VTVTAPAAAVVQEGDVNHRSGGPPTATSQTVFDARRTSSAQPLMPRARTVHLMRNG